MYCFPLLAPQADDPAVTFYTRRKSQRSALEIIIPRSFADALPERVMALAATHIEVEVRSPNLQTNSKEISDWCFSFFFVATQYLKEIRGRCQEIAQELEIEIDGLKSDQVIFEQAKKLADEGLSKLAQGRSERERLAMSECSQKLEGDVDRLKEKTEELVECANGFDRYHWGFHPHERDPMIDIPISNKTLSAKDLVLHALKQDEWTHRIKIGVMEWQLVFPNHLSSGTMRFVRTFDCSCTECGGNSSLQHCILHSSPIS